MRVYFKKLISLFLIVVLSFSLIGTFAFAEDEVNETFIDDEDMESSEIENHEIKIDEEEQTFVLPDDGKEYSYWINSSVADVVDLGDVINSIEEDKNAPSTLSYSATASNYEQAVIYLQSALLRRESPIKITYTKGDEAYNQLYEDAVAHTGEPEEGDYLLHNISSRAYSVEHSNSNYNRITITYYVRYFTTSEQEKEYATEANALLNQLGVLKLDPTNDYDRYEIVKTIYDWVINNVSYDYSRMADSNRQARVFTQQTAYGALIDRTAVCEGYANLIYSLLLASGVDCRIVEGTSKNEDPGHAWNLVDMSIYNTFYPNDYGYLGSWYYLDATWDAGGYYQTGAYHAPTYNYFLEGSYYFDQSHSDFTYSDNIDIYKWGEIQYYDYDNYYYDYYIDENRGYSFNWDSNFSSCVANYWTYLPTYNCTVKKTGARQYQARTMILDYNTGYRNSNGSMSYVLTGTAEEQLIELQNLGYIPRFTLACGCYMPDDNTVRINVGSGIRWYDSLWGSYSLDEFLASGVDIIFINSDYVDVSPYELTSDQIAYFRNQGIKVVDMESYITDSNAWSYLYGDYDMNDLDTTKLGFFNHEGFWAALLYHQYLNDIPQSVLDDLGITWIITDTVCNHNYDGNITWHWSEDGETCRASCICNYCGEEITVDADTHAVGIVSSPTCTEDGKGTYYATTDSNEGGINGGSTVYRSDNVTWVKKAQGHPISEVYCSLGTYSDNFVDYNDDGTYTLNCDFFTLVCGKCGDETTYKLSSITWAYGVIDSKAPTCTSTGLYSISLFVDLSNYNSLLSYYQRDYEFEIPKLSHTWENEKMTWNNILTSCVYSRDCSICGYIETHLCDLEEVILTEPTCTIKGEKQIRARCTTDDGNLHFTNREVELDALGHISDGEMFVWSDDYSSCTYDIYCTRCGMLLESYPCIVTSKITTEPTCDTMGERTYTATYTDSDGTHTSMRQSTVPALGHEYGTAQLSATFNPTDGVAMISMFCVECGEEDIIESPVAYNVVYNNDGIGIMTMSTIVEIDGEPITLTSEEYNINDIETIHNWELEDGYDATCTTEGKETYICADCDEVMVVTTEALGHKWNDPIFEWNDDYTECMATFSCAICDEILGIDCDITSSETDNDITYIATVTMDDNTYTDEQIVAKEPVVIKSDGTDDNNDTNADNSDADTVDKVNDENEDTATITETKVNAEENNNDDNDTNEILVTNDVNTTNGSNNSGATINSSNDGGTNTNTTSVNSDNDSTTTESAKTGDYSVFVVGFGVIAIVAICGIYILIRIKNKKFV